MVKVVIGVPSTDLVYADFAMALASMGAYSAVKGIGIMLVNKKGALIERSRQELAQLSLRLEVDYLFFLDSDMTFPPDILVKLLAHKKNIVACNCPKRGGQGETVARHKIMMPEKGGLTRVMGAGTGCMLINTQVFRDMEEPYFQVLWKDGAFLGEDYNFCNEARRAKHHIWCDFEASKSIGHIGQWEFKL